MVNFYRIYVHEKKKKKNWNVYLQIKTYLCIFFTVAIFVLIMFDNSFNFNNTSHRLFANRKEINLHHTIVKIASSIITLSCINISSMVEIKRVVR